MPGSKDRERKKATVPPSKDSWSLGRASQKNKKSSEMWLSAGIVAYTRSKENGEQKKSVNSAPVRSGRAEQQVTLLQQDYSSGAVLSIA